MSASTPTYLIGYSIEPAADHPGFDTHDPSHVTCWVIESSPERAEERALGRIERERWGVKERSYLETVTRDGCEPEEDEDGVVEDELLEGFDRAQREGEAYLWALSPRYPAYRVTAEVRRGGERAQAHYLLDGEPLADDGQERLEPGFWSPARAARAVERARALAAEAGWELGEVLSAGPVGFELLEEFLQDHYADMEDEGEVVVFVQEPGS
ncbi:MAG: hypothetical protein AB7N76_11665 [Planctomycetota bacterium]